MSTQPDLNRQRLADIMVNLCRARERTQTHSGAWVDNYYDLKMLVGDPEGSSLLATQLLDAIHVIKPDFVAGVPEGGNYITSSLVSASHHQQRPLRGLIVRKNPKEHGTRKHVECLRPGETLQGKTLAMVEDVSNTGESAILKAQLLQTFGAKIHMLTVIDREEGAQTAYQRANIPFTSLFRITELETLHRSR